MSNYYCRSCGAPIVWLKTTSGKSMPVDSNETTRAVWRDGALFDPHDSEHVSHFATCPQASEHRR